MTRLLVADSEHQIEAGGAKNPRLTKFILLQVFDWISGHFQFTEGGATVTPDTVQVWDAAPTRYRLAQPIVGNVYSVRREHSY